MDFKVVDMAAEGILLPPQSHLCQSCASAHSGDDPHNWESLYWQYWFYRQNQRWPVLQDAWAHCRPEVQAATVKAIKMMAERETDPRRRAKANALVKRLEDDVH